MGARLCACFVLVAGCSSFGVAPGDPDGGSASPDGGADASTLDGSAADASASEACVAPTCEGFDLATWAPDGHWNVEGAAVAVAGDGVSPPNALQVSVPANTAALAFIARDVPSAPAIVIRTRLRVEKLGTGSVDLFGVRCSSKAGATSYETSVLLTREGGSFAVQTGGGDAGAYHYDNLTTAFGEWTPVTLVASFAEAKYSFQIGTQTFGGSLPAACTPATLNVFVGAVYVAGVTSSWDVRFDNVEAAPP
ncbi:MAG: hypothetical protein JWP87_6419 [Labilithrix sp.]|nr:hypothetical protein [Labilithrix sp.]